MTTRSGADPAFDHFGPDRRFEVLGTLGAGGMGVVYAAFDRERNIRVALKTLPRIEPRALYRFKQEFRLLADLAHPNLAALYELFASGDQWFFTMELVEGVNFLRYVRADGRAAAQPEPAFDRMAADAETATGSLSAIAALPPPEHGPPVSWPLRDFDRLRGSLRQLAGALRTLHRAGRLHCDIKPSNVLVDENGRVVVLDFGLALEFDRRSSSAPTDGEVFGTAYYMAPEQANGGSLTPASDWYAVGAMVYEALTGRLPFGGSAREAIAAKQLGIPVAPRLLNPVVPDDLERLCLSLLQTLPPDRPAATEILRLVTGAPVIATPDDSSAVHDLIGREAHIAALRDAFTSAAAGSSVWQFVHGPSGVGKSAVAEHFVAALRAGDQALVFSGRCYEQESVQYKAVDGVVDALSRHLAALPDREIERILPADAALLSRMFPVLQHVDAIAAAAATAPLISNPQELRTRASAALAHLLAALARTQPVVLAIDDLQWGDVDSAALLLDVFAAAPPHVLLLGCYRREYAGESDCLRVLLEATPQGWDARALAVDALDAVDAERLAHGLLGTMAPLAATAAERIARESGGSPLFIRALVEHVQAEAQMPDAGLQDESIALDEVLRRRFNRLRPAARQLLDVVAVAGRPLTEVDAFIAADMTHRDPAVVGALRSAQLLRSSGGQAPALETYHDRIRETATALLPAAALTRLHRRLADTLAAKATPDAEWVAAHYAAAGEPARAADYFGRAAQAAAAALAFDRAATLYQRAVDLRGTATDADHYALLVGRADALANAGRGRMAGEAYQQAARLAGPADVLDLERKAGYQYSISGHLDQGRAVLSACLGRFGLTLPKSARRAMAPLIVRAGRVWLAERLGRLTTVRLRTAGDRRDLERLDVLWAAASALSYVDNFVAGALHMQYLLLALRTGEPGRLARGIALHAVTTSNFGERGRERAWPLAESARRLADEVGAADAQAMALIARAWCELQAQQWAQGTATLDAAEALLRGRCTGVAFELALLHMSRVTFLRVEGRYADAIRVGRAALDEARQRGDSRTEAQLAVWVLPDERLLEDDDAGARQALRTLSRDLIRGRYYVQKMLACLAEVTVDNAAGRHLAAWRRCERYWPSFSRSQMLRGEMMDNVARLYRAGSALAAIDEAPARAAALRAVATREARYLTRRKRGSSQAHADLLYGVIAARDDNREAAARHFAAAAEWFDAHGRRSFAASARLCQGALVGGREGARLIADAECWLAEAGFRTPRRALPYHVPGFPPALAAAIGRMP